MQLAPITDTTTIGELKARAVARVNPESRHKSCAGLCCPTITLSNDGDIAIDGLALRDTLKAWIDDDIKVEHIGDHELTDYTITITLLADNIELGDDVSVGEEGRVRFHRPEADTITLQTTKNNSAI